MKTEDQAEDVCIWCGQDWEFCVCLDDEEEDFYDPWGDI